MGLNPALCHIRPTPMRSSPATPVRAIAPYECPYQAWSSPRRGFSRRASPCSRTPSPSSNKSRTPPGDARQAACVVGHSEYRLKRHAVRRRGLGGRVSIRPRQGGLVAAIFAACRRHSVARYLRQGVSSIDPEAFQEAFFAWTQAARIGGEAASPISPWMGKRHAAPIAAKEDAPFISCTPSVAETVWFWRNARCRIARLPWRAVYLRSANTLVPAP